MTADRPAEPSTANNAAPGENTAPAADTLCEACQGIQRNWRRAPGHPELRQGLNRKEERGSQLVTITGYHCERCGTHWHYENNKADQRAGWSVVPR